MNKSECQNIFVSFAEEDSNIARKLVDEIENCEVNGYKLKCWYYLRDNPHGKKLETTRQVLDHCDHYLLVLSGDSIRSKWVARELGHIDERQSGADYPIIIGVILSSSLKSTVIQLRDFHSGELTGESYDFKEYRCLNLDYAKPDAVEELVKNMLPTTTVNPLSSDESELLENSFDLYEKLFPHSNERERREHIKAWLEDSEAQESPAEYYEAWSVLHIGCHPLAFCYLSVVPNPDHPFWFASYWGADKDYRQNDRAKNLLEETISELKDRRIPKMFGPDSPEWKGVVFEVDIPNFELLEKIASFFIDDDGNPKYSVRVTKTWFLEQLDIIRDQLVSAGEFTEDELADKSIIEHIRRLRRFWLYDRQSTVYSITDENNNPVPILSPAIVLKRDASGEMVIRQEDEHQYYLFVHLFESSYASEYKSTYTGLISFINDTFYFEAHGNPDDYTYIEGYEEYYEDFKDRMLEHVRSQGLSERLILSRRPILSRKSQRINTFRHRVLEKAVPDWLPL